jgi:hypothetical protein
MQLEEAVLLLADTGKQKPPPESYYSSLSNRISFTYSGDPKHPVAR